MDGIDDTLSPLSQTSQSTSNGFVKAGRAFSVPSKISVAPYRLNQRKQVNRLRQDSQHADFEITVSPAEQSVSILCSTGSYTLVAVPAFAQTVVGSTQHVGDIAMYCYDVHGKIDDIGASVVAVFFYRFTRSSDKSSAGGVTVHLHHTARRVQIQGSTMVTKQSRACVWFLEKYLLDKFRKEAEDKAVDISLFNSAVSKVVISHTERLNSLEKCQSCNVAYNGRSVREQCSICSKSFHRKCMQSEYHPCNIPPGPSTDTCLPSNTPAISADTVKIPVSSSSQSPHQLMLPVMSAPVPPPVSDLSGLVNSQPRQVHKQAPVPPGPVPDQACSDGALHNASPHLTAATPPYIQAPAHSSALNPSVPPFMPNPANTESGKPDCEKQPRGKTKAKAGVATTKEDVALEFSRIEVNTIKARLKTLEVRNKDLEFQNSILIERVAGLEKVEKDAIKDRYFPKSSTAEPPVRVASSHHTPVSHCPQIHCCVPRQCCQQPSPMPHIIPPSAPVDTMTTVLQKLTNVEAAISLLQSQLVSVPVITTESTRDTGDASTTMGNSTQHIQARTETDHDDGDSVVSVEEDIPELPEKFCEESPLNC